MSLSSASYLAAAQATITHVVDTQSGAIAGAADLIAASLADGGVLQAFGSGHSEAASMELAGRAGGLVASNKLALRDVVMYGGEPADTLADPKAERDPALARRVYDLANARPGDVFVITSQSGGNGSIVEMARIAREHGHPVVAITSLAHSRGIVSRHPSGQRLFELADVVIDNGAPHGDAVLPLPGGGTVCAVSSLANALIAQLITAEVVIRLLAKGIDPDVYLSMNVAGGDERNMAAEARHEGRIRRIAG
ncbi:SIS domain-containing protein [Longispora sp. K20-0274]|uniref:sugar isomerase domain-containing protein n=1 Tax=Longispora sp. K20-0274 TaxID=3088255 RepID=UPI00399ADBE4